MINLTDLPHDITLHRVFGPKEAAAFLGVTVTQLGRMRREGVLPPPLHYSQRRYGWNLGILLMYLDFIEMRDSGRIFRHRTDRNYFPIMMKAEPDMLDHVEQEQDWQQIEDEMELELKEETKFEGKILEFKRPVQ